MTEQVPCSSPGCERPANPQMGPLEVCREHGGVMDAGGDVEAWTLAVAVLRPWVESTRAIGFDRLTEVMGHALAGAEAAAELAQEELRRADEAAL